MVETNEIKYIYWEQQGMDKLCGVHCINSILQGPYFDEISLAQIAIKLDNLEKSLMATEGTETSEFQNFVKEDSGNVADDGNYSIQVLQEALKSLGSLATTSVDAQINKNVDMSSENGFICNSEMHWLAIRKINNIWYNLNSTNMEGPEIISDFYLSAFLQSVKENGYQIFAVLGNLPIPNKQQLPAIQKHQYYMDIATIKQIHEKNLKFKNYKLNIGGTDQRDIELAIQNSLKDQQGGNNQMDKINELLKGIQLENIEVPEEFKQKLEQKKQNKNIYTKFDLDLQEDQELWGALIMSISEKFEKKLEKNENNIKVNFKQPEGENSNWIFDKKAQIEDLYDFVQLNLNSQYKFILASDEKANNCYSNLQKTIEEEKLTDECIVFVHKI